MKFAAVATGGIGGHLAVRLTEAGHDVVTVARGAHLQAILADGLTLEAFDGTHNVRPWIATDDPSQVGPVDAIFFGVKGDQLAAAAELCRPMIGDDTVVIPFLNGVEAADRLAAILPPDSVANGMAQVSTTIAAPGLIKQTGEFQRYFFAERDSRPSARIDTLREAMHDAGVSAPPTDDIERDVWSKFVLFSAVSGVTAAARCTISDIVENPPLAELFRGIIAETAALGRARGVALLDTIEADTWAMASNLPGALRASTAIDLEHGRPLEIEWVSGAVKRLSEESGLEAPLNSAIYALLTPYRHGTN